MDSLQLYNDLVTLTESDAFYSQDFTYDGESYKVFNYRLASYTEFLKPGAIECRGIMYRVTDPANIELVTLPMQKFYNLGENPSTIGLDLSKVDTIELKADGSLMSTFMHKGKLRLKSKGSLYSQQAIDAQQWLNEVNPDLKTRLAVTDFDGWTVNGEWCGPDNRIVIAYDKPHMVVLNARNRSTGSYMSRAELVQRFGVNVNPDVDTKGLDVEQFVNSIAGITDSIEGYVCRIGDQFFKVKTDQYKKLHSIVSDIRSPRKLYEATVLECLDDALSLFTDPVDRKMIDEFQRIVGRIHNQLVVVVDSFCAANAHLNRKEFALLGQQKLQKHEFGLAMQQYAGKEVDYKKFMLKSYELFQSDLPRNLQDQITSE